MAIVSGLFIGKIEDRWPGKAKSAIRKIAVDRVQHLGWTGFDSDEQADLEAHGGRDKAVHHYAADHYETWCSEKPEMADRLAPGGFGENISTFGMTEQNLCIGDILLLGSARVQISQGRQPCWKLNSHIGDARMAASFQKTGRTGWYYRVLEPGNVARGDEITLIERPYPQWVLCDVIAARFMPSLPVAMAKDLAALPALAEGWRAAFLKKADVSYQENTDARLLGQ